MLLPNEHEGGRGEGRLDNLSPRFPFPATLSPPLSLSLEKMQIRNFVAAFRPRGPNLDIHLVIYPAPNKSDLRRGTVTRKAS